GFSRTLQKKRSERIWTSTLSFARSLAAIAVLEPHDVREMRRRDFGHVGVLNRDHAMDELGRDVKRVALAENGFLEVLDVVAVNDGHFSGNDKERLFLDLVELERKLVALIDVQDFSDIVLGFGPNQ